LRAGPSDGQAKITGVFVDALLGRVG